jgi:hypothetical protein
MQMQPLPLVILCFIHPHPQPRERVKSGFFAAVKPISVALIFIYEKSGRKTIVLVGNSKSKRNKKFWVELIAYFP